MAVVLAGLKDAVDELNTEEAIVTVGKMHGEGVGRFAGATGGDGLGCVGIDVGKGGGEGFGVTGDDAGGMGAERERAGAVGGADFYGGVEGFEEELLGHFLVPFEGAFGATDTDGETVFYSGGSLGDPEGTACAVFKMKEGAGVVVKDAVGGDGTSFCSDFGDFETGDKAGEVVGVSADVSHYEGGATGFGVEAPREGTVGRVGIVFIGFATLDIFDLDEADGAKLSVGDHGFGLTDEGVAGVVVGEAEDEAGFLNFLVQFLGVFEGVGEGFVADDVEAVFEGGEGVGIVGVVGGHDGDDVGSVGTVGFCLEHGGDV